MYNNVSKTPATVIPCLRYCDAPKAIEWLCMVFRFKQHLVGPNDDGNIAHAQLSRGRRVGNDDSWQNQV